ncbi:Retrotransposon protein [Phytophthora megakarya]|uniref:Retrotransposon protein n=1 Tax=Phytophthora megakarya TaxID=4795 RepID=A0A225WS55_9STRA|nr:Retrotransposon protein [Phytophthora megakarya]
MVVNLCEAGMKLTKSQSPKTDSESVTMHAKPFRALIGLHQTGCGVHCDSVVAIPREPGQQHWKATIRVLRYLKGTRDLGIIYNSNKGKVELIVYTDAD